jgi:regulatory subunit for Cdc7p protein kinase
MTRKHRKFAITMSNWAELDALIYHLQRPLKKEFDCL